MPYRVSRPASSTLTDKLMAQQQTQSILRYLADLAPTGSRDADIVQRKSEFAYLGWRPDLFYPSNDQGSRTIRRNRAVRRLAAIDSLHSAEGLLRLGWMFVCGSFPMDGKNTRFCLPLLSVPVAVQTLAGIQHHVAHRGDVEMSDDFFDDTARLNLEGEADPFGGGVLEAPDDTLIARLPKLQAWVQAALAAAGLPEAPVLSPQHDPLDERGQPGLRVVAGAALYTVRDVNAPNVAGTLLGWVSQPLGGTALEAVYQEKPASRRPTVEQEHGGDKWYDALWRFQRRAFDVFYGSAAPPKTLDEGSIRTTLPLNKAQREAVERSRRETVTVVSGPPGTGKSHFVAAVAIDEISRGNSVLIATQSIHAADVIASLFDRHPGPRYVRFGSRDSRESVAAELGDGLAQPLSEAEYRSRNDAAEQTAQRLRQIEGTVARLLEREAGFADGLRSRELNLLVAVSAPAVLDEGFDLTTARSLMSRIQHRGGWFAGLRSSQAEERLRELTRAVPEATPDDLEAALEVAEAEAAVRRGLAGGGLTLDAAWAELEQVEADYRLATGRAVEASRRARRNSMWKSTRSVAALASALRAGPVKRRQMLKELSGSDFLDVLPLWIGTLQEIDNTLPVTPGMFDVVIFDEASQIDQMRAAPALARAERAIVVGDPRQLRHVSFVSDEVIEGAALDHGLGGERARILDVRRNSLFDAAAAASSVTWLDEHFRSVPHIISFSDRAFYNGNLRLMTQHPAVETRDVIHTIEVTGSRNGDGVNQAELETVIEQVRQLAEGGHTSIGVVSPFRAQADAIEEAILAEYGPEDIDRIGLRVGTVHAFQGSERDVVVASLAIAPDDAAGSLRFMQDPNLFNVMVTRARREMRVVTSVRRADLPDGLLAEYLRHADHAPGPVLDASPPEGWAGEVFDQLQRFRLPVVGNYPVAGWSVDLAVGPPETVFGVECDVHPAGAATHIEQHLALRRAGWSLADAFQSRWLADPEGAAEMLSRRVLRDGGVVPPPAQRSNG